MKSPSAPNLIHPQIARCHQRHHTQIDFSVSPLSLNGSTTAGWCFPSLCSESSYAPPSDRPPPHPSPLYLAVTDVITIIETSTEPPSRKPPWYPCYWAIPSSLGLESNKFVVVFLLLLLCCLAWFLCSLFEFKFVLYMFAKCFWRTCLFDRYCITSKRLMAVITEFIILTITQLPSQHVAEFVISEIIYSRYVWTPLIIFFRSWMKSKTVDLKLLVTFGHMWKILAWLLRFVSWFVATLMFSESTICILRGILAILITCTSLKLWIGIVPIHVHFDWNFAILVVEWMKFILP
jgi:hypothetical protein